MKLRAVIPLSDGSIAVRDTPCIHRQCYTFTMMEPFTLRRARGGLNTTDQSGAEPTYRARVVTFGSNVTEHFTRYTIHKGMNGIKN